MRLLRPILSGLLLAALAACTSHDSGGPQPQPTPTATRLAYTDPTDANRWRLVRNPASSATRLVLDLLPPNGAAGRGATLVLSCGSAVSWAAVSGGSLVANAAYTGDLVLKGSPQGSDLRILASQKPGSVRTYGGSAVLSVALTLNGNANLGPVSLSASQGAHLGAAAQPEALDPLVGALQAQ